MNRTLGFFGVGAVIVASWLTIATLYARRPSLPPLEPAVHAKYDPLRIDRNIAFHQGRVKSDPGGAIGWSMLSGAYLARARESDDYAAAVLAEKAARTSLKLRTRGNLGAQTRLVNSLLQQHRFTDALSATEAALKIWTLEPQLNQLHADILIELGKYEQANQIVTSQPKLFANPAGQSVTARLAFLKGKPDIAIKLMRQATAEMEKNSGAPDDSVAWFYNRTGELLAMDGQASDARALFEKAANIYPRFYKAYANLARLDFKKGDWQATIRNGEKSNVIAPMADILALVGDAYSKLDDKVAAEKAYEQVIALAGKPGGPAQGLHEFSGAAGGHGHTLDRQYAMFCADHGRDLDGAYAAALRDYEARQDIYAFDTLAWVDYKRGELEGAKLAIEKAIALGTPDPLLYEHAAAIFAATKDARADLYVKKLAEVNDAHS